VSAGGIPAPLFQWRKNGADISGATANRLTIDNAQLADAGNYDVIILNEAGALTSQVAVLTIWMRPLIILQAGGSDCRAGGYCHLFR